MKTHLYRVCFSVRPTPGHPSASKFKTALLRVFLFAESPLQAGRKAQAIIAQLPYEFDCPRAPVAWGKFHDPDSHKFQDLLEKSAVEEAWGIGLSILLDAGPNMETVRELFDEPPAE